MCSTALVDSLECYMEDMVTSFQDFIRKSLILISLAIGALIAIFVYMIRSVNNRRLETFNIPGNVNNQTAGALNRNNSGGINGTTGAYNVAGGITSQPCETVEVKRCRSCNENKNRVPPLTKERATDFRADQYNAGAQSCRDNVKTTAAACTSPLCTSDNELLLNEVKLNSGCVPSIPCPIRPRICYSNPRISLSSLPLCVSKPFFEQVAFLCINHVRKWWEGDTLAVQSAVQMKRDIETLILIYTDPDKDVPKLKLKLVKSNFE